MSNNPHGIQGPKRTTMQRLAAFHEGARYVGASHGGKAHRGLATGLGNHSVDRRGQQPPPQRQADRCECEHYAECLDVAAHSNAKHVCVYPCGRFVEMPVELETKWGTNYPSPEAIAEALG